MVPSVVFQVFFLLLLLLLLLGGVPCCMRAVYRRSTAFVGGAADPHPKDVVVHPRDLCFSELVATAGGKAQLCSVDSGGGSVCTGFSNRNRGARLLPRVDAAAASMVGRQRLPSTSSVVRFESVFRFRSVPRKPLPGRRRAAAAAAGYIPDKALHIWPRAERDPFSWLHVNQGRLLHPTSASAVPAYRCNLLVPNRVASPAMPRTRMCRRPARAVRARHALRYRALKLWAVARRPPVDLG